MLENEPLFRSEPDYQAWLNLNCRQCSRRIRALRHGFCIWEYMLRDRQLWDGPFAKWLGRSLGAMPGPPTWRCRYWKRSFIHRP